MLLTITTVENYDSIFDFMFYQNGVVEVKATPIGYLLADNYRFQPPSESSFGEKVHAGINGNLHDHIFHKKVNLDVHTNHEATMPSLLLTVLNQTFSCAMPILSFAFKALLHNVHFPFHIFLPNQVYLIFKKVVMYKQHLKQVYKDGTIFSYSRPGKSMEVNSGKSHGVKLYPIFSTFPSRSILVERKAHLRGRE